MDKIKKLIADYNKIKQKRTDINFVQREQVVLMLVKRNEKDILWQYLLYEIKPLLEQFEGVEKEIVRQYFRFIGKQKRGYREGDFRIVTR